MLQISRGGRGGWLRLLVTSQLNFFAHILQSIRLLDLFCYQSTCLLDHQAVSLLTLQCPPCWLIKMEHTFLLAFTGVRNWMVSIVLRIILIQFQRYSRQFILFSWNNFNYWLTVLQDFTGAAAERTYITNSGSQQWKIYVENATHLINFCKENLCNKLQTTTWDTSASDTLFPNIASSCLEVIGSINEILDNSSNKAHSISTSALRLSSLLSGWFPFSPEFKIILSVE